MSRLSDLNRAALAAKQGYWWINVIAIGLSCVIARMSWEAYVEDSDRALVCIVSQALAIALAILARRALTAQMPWAAGAAFALASGCAWWASHGLALAWYGDAEANSQPMVIFMAILEPALFLLAEHVKEGQETLRAAAVRDEAETAEALRLARERDAASFARRTSETPAPSAPETNVTPISKGVRRRPGVVETAAVGAATILIGQGMPLSADAVPVAVEQPYDRPIVARQPSIDEIEQAREALARRGKRPSYRTVAAYVGVRKCDIEAVWPKGVPLAA